MYLSHESDLPKDPVMLLSIVNMKQRTRLLWKPGFLPLDTPTILL